MFAKYKNNIYRYRRSSRLVTENFEKAGSNFVVKSKHPYTYFYKDAALDDAELIDVYNIELWVKYDCGYPVFSKEWEIALSGQFLVDGKLVLEGNGDIPGWFRPEKHVSRNYIPLNDIESAWVTYRYTKKDGVILEKPLTIREDISIEKLVELRNYYGGKL